MTFIMMPNGTVLMRRPNMEKDVRKGKGMREEEETVSKSE